MDERRFENNPLLYLDFIFYFSNLSHPKLIYLTLVTPSPPRLNLVEPFIRFRRRLGVPVVRACGLSEATKATAQSGKVCTMRLFGLLCSWHLFFVVSTWADFGIGC